MCLKREGNLPLRAPFALGIRFTALDPGPRRLAGVDGGNRHHWCFPDRRRYAVVCDADSPIVYATVNTSTILLGSFSVALIAADDLS